MDQEREQHDEDERLAFLATVREGADAGRRYSLAETLALLGVDPAELDEERGTPRHG